MTTIDWATILPQWAHELVAQGILITDSELTIRAWNRWLELHSGQRADELIGRNLLEVYPDLATRHLDAYYHQALAGQVNLLAQRLHGYLLPMPVSDDQAAYKSMQQSAQIGPFLERGRVIGTITIIDDVTERVAHERELNQLLAQERSARAKAEAAGMRIARLQSVTAALSEALTPAQVAEAVVNHGVAALGAENGLVVLLTEDGAALEIVSSAGYRPETLASWQRMTIDAPVPLVDAVRTSTPILLESQQARDSRYPRLTALRAQPSGALAALPLIVEGRAIGALGLSFSEPRPFSGDDTIFMLTLAHQCAQAFERARLYEGERAALTIANEALKTRDVFFSIASHELKTPLTSLLGNAQLLLRRSARDMLLPKREQHAVEVIAEQAARLNKMIAALLDISRIEMGHLSIMRVPMDLCALITRVVAEVQPSLIQHALSWSQPDEPLILDGDELRLEQVLQNLIQNAIKYSPAGGTIKIWVEQRGNMARLSVSDEGIGIPEEALSQLFQRFYRAENATAQHISGMGIGLFVVKEIVSLHGGTVAVESVAGAGSTFTVSLPLHTSASEDL